MSGPLIDVAHSVIFRGRDIPLSEGISVSLVTGQAGEDRELIPALFFFFFFFLTKLHRGDITECVLC